VLFGLIRHRQQGYRRCPALGNRSICALSLRSPRAIAKGVGMSPTMKTVRWFALVVIGNLAAALPASMALSATASATPSENTNAVVVSQSTVDGVDYITREITIQPGGSTGWHYHDARVFGVVREGTLTRTISSVLSE